MARKPRMEVKEGEAYYHIISRTLWRGRKDFNEYERGQFVNLLQKLSRYYLVDVIAYTVVPNQFHLLIKIQNPAKYGDKEIMERAKSLFGYTIEEKPVQYWREKLSSISAFVKGLKQRYSQWYNRRNKGKGNLWTARFKSILIEEGKIALAAAAYIDLLPEEIGMERSLGNYHYCSYAARQEGPNWLTPLSTLKGGLSFKEYRRFLKNVARMKKEGKVKKKKIPGEVKLALNYKPEGLVFGKLEFVEKYWGRIKNKKPEKISEGFYIV